jgi:putative sterol carrier protein
VIVSPAAGADLDDPHTYFTEWIPSRIAQRGDLGQKLGDTAAVAQVHLSGERGGTWHFVIEGGRIQVGSGPHEAPCFVVMMGVKTFRKLRSKQISPQLALMSGKVKIRGSAAVAFKLASLLR